MTTRSEIRPTTDEIAPCLRGSSTSRRLSALAWLGLFATATLAQTDPLTQERPPLPAERDAAPLWFKALPELKWPRDPVFRDALHQIANLASNLPPADATDPVRAWLQSKEQPLAWISEGIARGSVRYPQANGAWSTSLGFTDFIEVAHAKQARLRFRAEAGEYAAAADEALEIVAMGRIVADGNGPVINYLIGNSITSLAACRV